DVGTEIKFSNLIEFNKEQCIGCANCVRACPTQAIRIRHSKSFRLVDLCIACGECVRVCPARALTIKPNRTPELRADEFSVAVVSPELYSQFPGNMPNDVLIGLRRMGFKYVIDNSDYLEMIQFATDEFIRRARKTAAIPFPVISPFCPVVERLIAFRFPTLLDQILPIKRPVHLMEKEVRNHVAQETGISVDKIVFHHITSCQSKVISARSRKVGADELIQYTWGFNEIYPQLLKHLDQSEESDTSFLSNSRMLPMPSGRGVMWGLSGGELTGLRIVATLAVSGISETIAYLEKVEMGALRGIEYLELRACPESCIGGAMVAIDKYMAKSHTHRMVKVFGLGRRLPREKILPLYDQGWFFTVSDRKKKLEKFGRQKAPLSIDHLAKIESLKKTLGNKDCGLCGAPTCHSLAEDIVRGDAQVRACVLTRLRAREKQR
ncbi:[Fe-Fe] hydrogenase large subunit C-terminal domain-containing protein, partial [Desulfobacterales bacterium HSG17]|nr:[Fe-Fe] hydrogenase large subunit C-terminal domain-containing protein [Desulfobacterales bacterium HSG17]